MFGYEFVYVVGAMLCVRLFGSIASLVGWFSAACFRSACLSSLCLASCLDGWVVYISEKSLVEGISFYSFFVTTRPLGTV